MTYEYSEFATCECCEHRTANCWRCEACAVALCFTCEQPHKSEGVSICENCYGEAQMEARIEARAK